VDTGKDSGQKLMDVSYRSAAGPCTNMANTSWLIVIFGECQLIAKLITRGSPVTPLIHKDFRVCHPLLARRNYAALTLNHQKW
jgi:hypothetical protein